MERNASNPIDWSRHWRNFNFELYLAILKAKQQ